MDVKIGTGPNNWGVWFPSDSKQIPWDRYLDEAAEVGYEWTELGPYGYLPTDAKVLKKELDKRGLKLEAGFVFDDLIDPGRWNSIKEELLSSGELSSSLGAKHHLLMDTAYTDLFTGKPLRPAKLNDDQWKYFIETQHRLATILKERFGLQAVSHPHAETHLEYVGQIEKFLEETDPELISLCLDTGHHAYRGGDPVAFMREHHQRMAYLHIKSVDAQIQNKVEQEMIPFAKAVAMGLFVELSQGVVNFPNFVEVLEEIDYHGFAIVEQDMYPAPFDKPKPFAKRNRDYLREIGLG